MATILTGITNPYQSKGSLHSNSKPMNILPRAKSEEDWPRRNPFHPSSPPVRERSRYAPVFKFHVSQELEGAVS